MTYSIYQLLGLFLIYSFLGWCTEVSFVALSRGEVVNRGFLNGPVCPIYGVGMICVLVVLTPVSDNTPLLFFGGMIFCSLIELIGGWVLERVFDTRWWDYSKEPFNLGGYVCLRFSIAWGLAVTFVVRLIHPALLGLVDWVPHTVGIVLEAALYVLFLTDLGVTITAIVGIKRQIRKMERVAQALHAVGDGISGRLGNSALAADARLEDLRESGQEKLAEGREKLAENREKVAESRQKLETRVNETIEEIQARRAQLEETRERFMEEYRERFMVRRLGRAFPDVRKALQEHLEHMDQE